MGAPDGVVCDVAANNEVAIGCHRSQWHVAPLGARSGHSAPATSAIARSGRQLSAARLNTPAGMWGSMPRTRSAWSADLGQKDQVRAAAPKTAWAAEK